MSTTTTTVSRLRAWLRALQDRFALPSHDLLRDLTYRRLWSSILISSFGGKVMMLALPLTAAVLLQASPTQMGLLTTMELLPHALLSLPCGVWLDRVRKLPVYIAGELSIAAIVASVPLAWWMGWLSMSWMYVAGFLMGCVYVMAGAAAQIVLTQVVARERLVEAHAKNALATSGAELTGPGLAGVLIKLVGAPLALLVDAFLLLISVGILRGIRIAEVRKPRAEARFWRDLAAGVRFVHRSSLLVSLALAVGLWQLLYNCALVVLILFATRTLGLNEHQVGLSYVGVGLGTIAASTLGGRISRRLGPGRCLALGIAVCSLGWSLLAMAPANRWGVATFAFMLLCKSTGTVLIYINFLALRQAATPEPLLGRMSSTMRWLVLIPAAPGALIGGALGEHVGLRAALGFSGAGALVLALWAWSYPVIRRIKELPTPEPAESLLAAEATVRPAEVVQAEGI